MIFVYSPSPSGNDSRKSSQNSVLVMNKMHSVDKHTLCSSVAVASINMFFVSRDIFEWSPSKTQKPMKNQIVNHTLTKSNHKKMSH